MQITFDGEPVQDAVQEMANLARLGYPVPPEMGRANCFVNIIGPQPARGWFLLTRDALDTIDEDEGAGNGLDTLHTVVFTDDSGNTIQLNNLVIASEPIGITTGMPNDADNVFLVEVADRQQQLNSPFMGVPCFRQYNVRAPAFGGSYYAGSLSGGTVTWTWLTMVQDLWGLMSTQLGTAPSSLPFTPNGTPEGWQFPGVSAWAALNQVLYRIGCAIKYDPTKTSNQYSLVQVGVADTSTDTTLSNLEKQNRLIFSEEPINTNLGQYPGKVRVYFHTQYLHYGTERTTPQDATQWLTGAIQSVDVAGTISGTDPTIIHPIWDDLPALANPDGTISNLAAMATRAAERAADFYRMTTGVGGMRLRKIYRGILPTVQPSSSYRGVAWRQDLVGINDRPGGLVTEVVRFPWWIVEVKAQQSGPLMDDSGFSISNRPPWFGPQPPNYPHLLQVVNVTNGTPDGSGRYSATVEQLDPTLLTDTAGESCLAFELNGGTLTTQKYLARLCGYSGGKPLYRVMSPASGSNVFSGNFYEPPPTATNLSTSQNNYTLPTGTTLNFNVTATINITGITADSGRVVEIRNIGTNSLTLPSNSASSTSTNRIYTPDSSSIIVKPGDTAVLKYDPVGGSSGPGWYPVNKPYSSSGGSSPPYSTQSGSSYAIASTDGGSTGGTVVRSHSGAMTDTLPSSPATPPWSMTVVNTGTGADTITPSSGTVNGNATYTVPAGSAATFSWDGTNYEVTAASGGGSSPSGGGGTGVAVQQSSGLTTSSLISVYTATNNNGLGGCLCLRNAGANSLNFTVITTDTRGNNLTSTVGGIGSGGSPYRMDALTWNTSSGSTHVVSPLTTVTIQVEDGIAGNHTTWQIDSTLG